LGSASSTAARYDLFDYFIYVFFVYVLSSSTMSATFDYIDGMSLLFSSFSEVNLMICCLLV
jgi:hypothetical protein